MGNVEDLGDSGESGFTLIELLVVMIIIGILAAIAVPSLINQRQQAYRTSLKVDLRNAATGVESAATTWNGDYTQAGGLAAGTALPAASVPFTASAGNTVTVTRVNANNYCVSAVNAALGGAEVWSFTKNGQGTGNPSSAPVKAACPAAIP